MHKENKSDSNINPTFLESSKLKVQKLYSLDYYVNGILSGDKICLSRAITLVESKVPKHIKLGSEILKRCLPESGKSIRIGISGSPGVGKSTFIEALGMFAIGKGKKCAVLAIDPASTVSKGSILGDKTRMAKLSAENDAFIRPSSSGGELGGIQRNTKESIILCEAAGYNVIFIETVGVGQAETKVRLMVDFFILLILPGAGDEMQGIKRGIVELADLILINKADGERVPLAKNTRQSYSNALHLMGSGGNHGGINVQLVSATEHLGIGECWDNITEYFKELSSDLLIRQRKKQDNEWFEEQIRRILLNIAFNNDKIKMLYREVLLDVNVGKINTFEAIDKFMAQVLKLK